jgi:hypothetical protein
MTTKINEILESVYRSHSKEHKVSETGSVSVLKGGSVSETSCPLLIFRIPYDGQSPKTQ